MLIEFVLALDTSRHGAREMKYLLDFCHVLP